MTIKTATHNNLTCEFDSHYHRYTVKETGQVLTSGTTFIKRFFQKFDAPAVAKETAIKRGTTPEALIAEWKEKGETRGHEGDLVHSYSEYVFNEEIEFPPYPIEADRVGFLTVQMLLALDKLYEKGFEPIEAEKIIFSPSLGVAGQIDLLLWAYHKVDPLKKELVILDWKTNEILTLDNPFQNALPPIEHLEDANLIHHSLQLSLYQYILQIEDYYPEATEYKRLIIHLQEDCSKPYFAKYLEDEIEGMVI